MEELERGNKRRIEGRTRGKKDDNGLEGKIERRKDSEIGGNEDKGKEMKDRKIENIDWV